MKNTHQSAIINFSSLSNNIFQNGGVTITKTLDQLLFKEKEFQFFSVEHPVVAHLRR